MVSAKQPDEAASVIEASAREIADSYAGYGDRFEVLETLPSTTPLDVVFVPDDPRACDDALLAGEPVTAVRNRSGFAKGIRELASRINSTHVHTARAG